MSTFSNLTANSYTHPLTVGESVMTSAQVSCGGITVGKIGSLNCGTASFNYTQKENEYMETLYQVTVVAKTREILLVKETVVAVDQENAKYLVGLYDILKEKNLSPADVTVIVMAIGQVKIEKTLN